MTAGDDGWAHPDPCAPGGRHRARGRRRVDHDGVAAAWLLAALLGTAACALPSAVPVRPAAQHTVLPDLPVPHVAVPHVAPPLPVTLGVTPATPAVDAEQAPADFTSALPDDRAAVAVRTAMAQIGLPYEWGGNGPTAGDDGFDCSGLTTFAYAAAGIGLPRTAATQYAAGPHVPADAPLQPGDLVFYGTPGAVHHVGMYIGDGRMVNAPTFGKPVQTAYYRWRGDDYLGSTRPAATGPTTRGRLPAVPSEGGPVVRPPRPTVFDAPPAPPPTDLPRPATSLPPEPVTAASAVAAADPTTTTLAPAVAAADTTTTLAPASDGADPSTATSGTSTVPEPGAANGAPTASSTSTPPPTTLPPTTLPPTTLPPTTLPPTTLPPTTLPPTTLPPTTLPPTTLPPTTLPPTTLPPTTLPPTTLPPTTGPSASAGPAATTTQPPVPAPPAQLVVGDSGVPLLAVAAPATGVPAAPQAGGRIAEADGRTVVVLAATEEPAVRPGRAVTVRGADGAERTWTVRVLRPVPEPALTPALAPAGGLLVVMGGPGARTVLIAT